MTRTARVAQAVTTVGNMGPRASKSSRGLAPVGEREFLARLRRRLESEGAPAGEVHIGDDAAVLTSARGRALFALDVLVEGVHVDLGLGTLEDAGWKAVAVNVSDIAAMGGVPTYAVVGVAAPPGSDLDRLYHGMEQAARRYGIALVGGDLSSAEALFISVAILGETSGLAPVLRSGARPGDEIWCTGPLGSSAAGLALLRAQRGGTTGDTTRSGRLAEAYLRPTARVQEGRLAAELGATAMIDVSDGLARDAAHIAVDSGVGIALEAVPVADGATEEQALGGGEDYELVFAIEPGSSVKEAFSRAGLSVPIRLGRVVDDPSVRTLCGAPLPDVGWEHTL
jgi:thiamine-monophosphate kinase